jgi:cell division protein FtsB
MKKLGIILFILAIIYFIFLIRQDIMDNLGLKREIVGISKELREQKKLANDLNHKLKALNTNSYIEELARTKLGMIKKGETPYKVIEQGVK